MKFCAILVTILTLTESRYIGYQDPDYLKNKIYEQNFLRGLPLPITGPIEKRPSGFLDYSSNRQTSRIIRPVIKHGPPIISKSYFLHEAPYERNVEEKHHTVHPRKHYNIVFVKTPLNTGHNLRNNINYFPQNEEKTVVYVLVGNGVSETNSRFSLPKPKPPNKPEVVFVKYNNEDDAQRAISDIQDKYNYQQGSSVSILGLNDDRHKRSPNTQNIKKNKIYYDNILRLK